MPLHGKPPRFSAAKGFVGSSMREIADSIGVEASSLYNHIGSKSEIPQSICFKVANDFNQHLDEVTRSDGNTLVKLENLIRFHTYDAGQF